MSDQKKLQSGTHRHPLKQRMPLIKSTAGLPGQTWKNVGNAKEVWEDIRRNYPEEFNRQAKRSFFVWLLGLFGVLRQIFKRSPTRT